MHQIKLRSLCQANQAALLCSQGRGNFGPDQRSMQAVRWLHARKMQCMRRTLPLHLKKSGV